MKVLKIVKPNGDVHFAPAESLKENEAIQVFKPANEKNKLTLIEESEMNELIASGELKEKSATGSDNSIVVSAQIALAEKDVELSAAKAAKEAAIKEAEDLKAQLEAFKAAQETAVAKEKEKAEKEAAKAAKEAEKK